MILAQDGFGDASKIEQAVQLGIIDGYIICPKNRMPARTTSLVHAVSAIKSDAIAIFDPEYQAAFVKGATNLGKLPEYDYFTFPLSFTLKPKQYEEINEKTINFQKTIGATRFATPSPIIDDYDGISGYSSKMFAWDVQESQSSEIDKMLISLVLNVSILSNRDSVDNLLNEVTNYSAKGFYIVIDHSSNGETWNNPGQLASLMLIVNVLSQNGFEVYVGYSDGAGLLLLAAGATGIGTGWWKGSRVFNRNTRYFDSVARRPKKAYFSKSLLNFISLDSLYPCLELEQLNDSILNKFDFDEHVGAAGDNSTWTDNNAVLNYWKAMKEFSNELAPLSTEEKLNYMQVKTTESKQLYGLILAAGLSLGDNESGNFTNVWLSAIELFRKDAL